VRSNCVTVHLNGGLGFSRAKREVVGCSRWLRPGVNLYATDPVGEERAISPQSTLEVVEGKHRRRISNPGELSAFANTASIGAANGLVEFLFGRPTFQLIPDNTWVLTPGSQDPANFVDGQWVFRRRLYDTLTGLSTHASIHVGTSGVVKVEHNELVIAEAPDGVHTI
jgi:hypothetical protein